MLLYTKALAVEASLQTLEKEKEHHREKREMVIRNREVVGVGSKEGGKGIITVAICLASLHIST